MKENTSIGKIISISDLNVRVLLKDNHLKLKDVLYFEDENKIIHKFEVIQIDSKIAMAVPFDRVQGLKKGIDLYLEPKGLTIEYSDNILGRMFNSYGQVIDGDKFTSKKTKNVYEKKLSIQDININGDILLTGIKAIDFFAPIEKGFKMGLIRRCWSRKNSTY